MSDDEIVIVVLHGLRGIWQLVVRALDVDVHLALFSDSVERLHTLVQVLVNQQLFADDVLGRLEVLDRTLGFR